MHLHHERRPRVPGQEPAPDRDRRALVGALTDHGAWTPAPREPRRERRRERIEDGTAEHRGADLRERDHSRSATPPPRRATDPDDRGVDVPRDRLDPASSERIVQRRHLGLPAEHEGPTIPRVLDQAQDLVGGPLERPAPAGLEGTRPQSRGETRIVAPGPKRGREVRGVGRLHEGAAHAVIDHIADASDRGRHHGSPDRERLEDDVRQSFIVAGEDQRIGR